MKRTYSSLIIIAILTLGAWAQPAEAFSFSFWKKAETPQQIEQKQIKDLANHGISILNLLNDRVTSLDSIAATLSTNMQTAGSQGIDITEAVLSFDQASTTIELTKENVASTTSMLNDAAKGTSSSLKDLNGTLITSLTLIEQEIVDIHKDLLDTTKALKKAEAAPQDNPATDPLITTTTNPNTTQ